MNIAIVGPPGAGKTKLAKEMRAELASLHASYKVKIVDGYAARLKRDTGLALGPYANWSENYMVAGYRRALELKARQSNHHTITCGTILDTMYYCGMVSQAEIIGSRDPQSSNIIITAAMSGIGLWFRSDWDYDLAFCVGAADDAEGWIAQYADDIPPLAQSLLIPNMYGYESHDEFDPEFFFSLVTKTDKQPV